MDNLQHIESPKNIWLKIKVLFKKWIIGEWWKELKYLKGTPSEVALSYAIGVFIGFTPTIGFQTALCYAVARLFNKSFIILFLGSSTATGIPWLIPPVYYFEYWLGCKILKVPFLLSHFPHSVNFSFLISLGKPLLIGSIVPAITGGLVSYFIVFIILKFFKKEKVKT